jgi:hypothetical protein
MPRKKNSKFDVSFGDANPNINGIPINTDIRATLTQLNCAIKHYKGTRISLKQLFSYLTETSTRSKNIESDLASNLKECAEKGLVIITESNGRTFYSLTKGCADNLVQENRNEYDKPQSKKIRYFYVTKR